MFAPGRRRKASQKKSVNGGMAEGGRACEECGTHHLYRDGTWIITAAGTFLCGNDVCWRERVKKEEAVS